MPRTSAYVVGIVLLVCQSSISAAQSQVNNRNQIVNGHLFTWNNAQTPSSAPATGTAGVSFGVVPELQSFSWLVTQVASPTAWSAGDYVIQNTGWIPFSQASYDFHFATAIDGFATDVWFSCFASGTHNSPVAVEAYLGTNLVSSFVTSTGGCAVPSSDVFPYTQAQTIGVAGALFDRIFLYSVNGRSGTFALNQLTLSGPNVAPQTLLPAPIDPTIVPEPSPLLLCCVGIGMVLALKVRRRSTAT